MAHISGHVYPDECTGYTLYGTFYEWYESDGHSILYTVDLLNGWYVWCPLPGGIVRSKTAAYPYTDNPGGEPLGGGFVRGPFGCDRDNKFYSLNGTCPEDRRPYRPPSAVFMSDTDGNGLNDDDMSGRSHLAPPI